VSQLLQQLRSSNVIDQKAIDSALRRQQIYGGSLDTVLLELDLISAPELNKQLALANNCETIAAALLEPGPERPWDALPKPLLDLGWAMPLRRHMGHIQVAVHPEIPIEQRNQLERSVEHLQVFVTCEACLAKLAAERRSSVMPQRYAVLALKWMQALKREQPKPQAEVAAPSAPWLAATPDTAPYKVPPPDDGPVFRTPSASAPRAAPEPVAVAEPKPGEPGEPRPMGRSTTLLYGLPVDDDDDTPPDPEPEAEPEAEPEPPAPEPEPLEPAAEIEEDVPAPRIVATRGAEPRPTASLHERLAGPRSVLEDATQRDVATEALVRAAMVINPRVALFGIKREGLRGLPSPGQIPEVVDQLVELEGKIESAVEGHTTMDRVNDLDLRIAVGREMAVPCIFLPIRVQDRPVLMLYIDRDNDAFTDEEVDAARELCELAGRTLEGVLRRLRGEPDVTPDKPDKPFIPPLAPAAPSAAASGKPSLFSVPSSLLPPGQLPAPGAFKPPSEAHRITPAPVPVPPPVAAAPIAPPPISPGQLAPPIRAVPRPVTPPPFVPPSIAATPAAIPPVRVPPIAAPPAPEPVAAKPPVRTTPPPAAAVQTPASQAAPPIAAPPSPAVPSAGAADKPPIRVHRPEPSAELPLGSPEPPPASKPSLTPLSPPIGYRGGSETIRGRIQIEDDDRPRKPDAKLQEIDASIASALRGDSAAVAHLRDLGEPALRRIAKQFPGELDVNRRDLDTLPPLPAHGGLIRVALEIGPDLGPYLVEYIDHPNPVVRFYIAFVFMELRHELAVAALGELAFDPDADVRAIAMRVLETYSGEIGFLDTVTLIRRELDSPNRTRALHATRAVGTLRDIEAVPKLIELLTSKERYIQEASLESLCSVTGQQLGLKPHRWESWYGENSHHHRVEWIMSSLAHKDLSVRRWAADELRRITGQRINFLAAGSKQEREIGLRKWIEWWDERGRSEFGGS
jgi:HEAT repeat protein